MVIDITEPDDNLVLMLDFHTHFQGAKQQVAERMEAQSSPGVYEHGERTSADFGKHAYNSQFALVHTDLATLQGYTPKVDGSLHIVASGPDLYTVEDGALVHLSFLDHSTLKNLDDTLHNADFFSSGTSIILAAELTVLSGGSLTPSAQEYSEDDDPLDPDHISKSHYDAHGSASITDSNVADNTLRWNNTSPYYTDSVLGLVMYTYGDDGVGGYGGSDVLNTEHDDSGVTSVNNMAFLGRALSTGNEVST